MPLAVDAAAAVLTSLANEARAIFQVRNSPILDPGGFLASPDTPPLSQQPVKALGRAVCRSWARRNGDSNNPAADRLYGSVCAPYLDSISEGVDDGDLGRPFVGGQCDLAKYQVVVAGVNASGAFETFPRIALGPIVGARAFSVTPTIHQVQLLSRGNTTNASGTCSTTVTAGPQDWRTIGVAGSNYNPANGARFWVQSVTACPGQPNNCGSPPPDYRPPRPRITLPPITPIFIDLPDIGQIDVNISFFPDATFQLCSEDLDVCVEVNPPDREGGGAVGVGPGEAGTSEDTTPGGVVDGEAPPEQELVGVRVEVISAPIGANEYQNNAATIYRGIGYVRMGYPGRLALDMGGAALISPQFFFAPVGGLTNWEVRANLGYTVRVTPYYRDLP